ncbi:Pre-B-cell leukemia transcription factor 4, partial [Brachionus plicatilis]
MTAHLASSTLYPMHDSIVAEAKKLANKMILEPQTSTPLKIPTNFLANQGEQMVKQEAKDGQKSTRFLSNRAVSLLNKWFIENRDYPYPDEQTTDYLAREAEISVKQVKKWFANKRVRSQLCCKPIHRNRKSKNSSQLNESIKYSRQQEVAENGQTNESQYPFLRIPINQHYQQQQRQQSVQQLPPSSLLQPAIGLAHRMSCQMPAQPSLSLMRPLDSCVPNSAASPLYGQLMLMNLIATQRHAQMQSLNLLSKFSNQSSSTTSASISSAVSNSSANSNEDY